LPDAAGIGGNISYAISPLLDQEAPRPDRTLHPDSGVAASRRAAVGARDVSMSNCKTCGVRSLSVSCWLCHHGAVLAVDRWADEVPVPSFGPRMVCTGCGIVGADARPDWTERPARASLTGTQWS
jgi:hypothetical protein